MAVSRVERANLRNLAKFRDDWSNCYGDIGLTIHLFFGRPHLGFVVWVIGPSTKGVWWSLSLCEILLKPQPAAVVLIICKF